MTDTEIAVPRLRPVAEQYAIIDLDRDEPVVAGTVVPGDQRGRTLGFPTANLVLPTGLRIRDGVWAADVVVEGGRRFASAVSIGHRPTYYGRSGVRLLEAYLLDFSESLYGTQIIVTLRKHLRPQRRFRSSEELVRQLDRDVAATARWAKAERVGQPGDRPRRGEWGASERRPVRDTAGAIAARRERRRDAIAEAARQAKHDGCLTHEAVSERAGVPVGLLRWSYPTVGDLAEMAEGA
ncbi:riboflavin kinase [Agromyces sp. SYSU T00194]|uniref:riboflavin kinase n=1 Tax=Agromyces chitinivorans TaxID=3158560 RepID=UPI00339A0C95